MTALADLRTRLAEISDLSATGSLLFWDQQTMMPPRGVDLRAEQHATLERLVHERFTGDDVGRLLEAAAAELNGTDPDSDDARIVGRTRRDWEKARRVPVELKAEMAKASTIGEQAWVEARATSDFSMFAPHLERQMELRRRYVECFDVADPYDALLDDFEEGASTAHVADVFARVRDGLVPLISGAAERDDAVDDSSLYGDFPLDRQRVLVREVVAALGWDAGGWRLDDAVHPFAIQIAHGDNRITTRYDQEYVGTSLYSAIHEMGHGLYEAGVARELARTGLAHGVSLGMHESQSRLWENLVGRGRPFVEWLHPRLTGAFPEQLGGLDADSLYRAVNRIRPSLIRVEADEATYSLHIILRFEIERELLAGKLAVGDLPAVWNERMRSYLGVAVPDDAHGVLQDVHWSAGLIGYFPTYALGNIVSAQLWARASADLPDLDAQLAAGDFAPLREWLREHVHRWGRKLPPSELLDRVVGGPLDPGPYLDYLTSKYSALYGLA